MLQVSMVGLHCVAPATWSHVCSRRLTSLSPRSRYLLPTHTVPIAAVYIFNIPAFFRAAIENVRRAQCVANTVCLPSDTTLAPFVCVYPAQVHYVLPT